MQRQDAGAPVRQNLPELAAGEAIAPMPEGLDYEIVYDTTQLAITHRTDA